jgi:hypothetical protein
VAPIDIFQELEKLARRLGLVVRIEPFEFLEARGGICRVKGVPTVIVPSGLPLLDKIGVLSAALGRFNLEVLYVPPIVRRRISRQKPHLSS